MVFIRRAAALLLATALTGVLPTLSQPHPAAAANDNTPWYLPSKPPKCTTTQVSSGNVAGCLLYAYDAPDAVGWPSPPFMNDPTSTTGVGVVPLAGWTYSGFGYNGSPALADWERQLTTNSSAVGPVKANQIKSLPDALPLFEGFLRDIAAGGYKITDAGTYSFRCTSSTSKSCQGLTRDDLSLHSWGLAMDMNSGANPAATYYGINGASACATPIQTDIPHWVVQTAEKWGLYWGGYGWSTGCDSPSQIKTSASRDITHFEFRGSPANARAIAAVNLGGSCLTVADDGGVIGPRCISPGDTPGAGWRVVVDTKAPAGATAALVNITATGATAAGYVTAESCAATPAGQRSSSNGNVVPGQTAANLSVVPLDSAGRFCLYRSQPMHTVVDVQGFFAPPASAGATAALYTPVTPQRVLDTRSQPFCTATGSCTQRGPVNAGAELAVNAPMLPTGAVAVLANLTVTEPTTAGYLTADSCPTLTPGPQTHSNTNFSAGDTVANLSVVPVVPITGGTGGAQFCTYATAPTQNVVDVQGYFSPAAGGLGFTSMPTQRILDTRGCWTGANSTTQRCAQLNDTNSVIHLKAPAGASAVLINLTLTGATADGFATAEACSLTTGAPGQSSGNVARGATAANLAIVSVDPDGTFCVVVSAPMHVVVDVQGSFSPTGALRFMPMAPVRRNDTRLPGGG